MVRRAELLVVGFGRASGAALALISFVVLTRLLPPGEFALIALLMAFSSFAGLVLLNPAGQWVSRHIHEWHDRGLLADHFKDLLRLIALVAAVVGCFAAIWYLITTGAGLVGAMLVGVAVAALIHFSTATLACASALNSLGQRTSAVVWQLTMNALGLLFAAMFVQANAAAPYWLAGLALGAMPAFFGAGRKLKSVLRETLPADGRESVPRRAFVFQADFLTYAYPLAAVTVLLWLEGNGYRFVLERVWTAKDLGLFLMALSVPAQLTAVLESAVTQFAYPYFFRSLAGVSDKARMASLTSTMTSALLPLYWIWGSFLFVLAPQFLYLVAGTDYHGAADWMVVGVVLEVARLTGNAWLLSSQASKDYRPMALPFAVGAAGSLLTCLLVALLDGPLVAVVAGLIAASLLKCAFIVVRARSMLALRVPLKRMALAGLLLVTGFSVHGFSAINYGPGVSLAVLLSAGLAGVALGYFHLRTASDLHVLLGQKLG